MATPTVEEEVVLDADTRALFQAMAAIEQRIKQIRNEVGLINDAAAKGAKTFDATLNQTAKNLSRALGGLRTLSTAGNQPSGLIQGFNSDKALAKQTLDATAYARELNTARNATEALNAKIAKLNQTAAKEGRDGGLASIATTDKLKRLEAASQSLKQLDRQYEQLEGRARRMRQTDLSPQINAVSGARDALFTAATNPRTSNLGPQINALTDAQAALAERIALARREEATALRTAAVARRELAVADASSLRTLGELDQARINNANRLRELRGALRTASDGERSELLASLEVEKARGRQLQANTREVQAQARAEAGLSARTNKAVAPLQMRTDAAAMGAQTVLSGTRMEQELAMRQLLAAATDRERIEALRALDLANARVSAAKRLVDEENKTADAVVRANEAARRDRAANSNTLAGSAARAEIDSVGLYQAQAAAKARVLAAQERLATTTGLENAELRKTVELEQKKLNIINQEVRAAEQLALADRRQNEKEQRQSIVGRLATAGRNTALYGGVAMLGFGALSELQQGLQFVVQFEDELAKLQAIANATAPQMQTLKAAILEVGENSRYSLTDLAKISQTLAQAGVSAGQMGEVLASVTTLATASGSTPDEAVNLVTSALGAFQLQASETARVADLMTSALNRTKLTVAQTGQAIQYVGATAFEQNISLETLLATVGAMAQAGIKSGSTIGTGLRQLFVDLQTPSAKLVDQLKAVGLTIADVNVAVHGEQEVLRRLSDAGFGATQAYSGLETRAAAAYLVLKNNQTVIDDLQLAFAQSGAAADANARAMDSLSAQWQRFKNIVSGNFFESMEAPMNLLKDLIRNLADAEQSMASEADKLAKRQAQGYQGYVDRAGGSQIMGTIAYENDNLLPDTGKMILKLQNAALDLLTPKFYIGGKGMGQEWDEYINKTQAANLASADLATQINETSEKVEAQRNKVSEVEKEIARLVTQHASLSGNSTRTQAETVTLSNKFEGLAKYLTNAKDRYGDLINAMRLYNDEASRTLATELSGQISVQKQEENRSLTAVGGLRSQVLANSALMQRMTPQERAAVNRPRAGNNELVVGSAARRLNDPALLKLSEELGKNATAMAQVRLGTDQLTDVIIRQTNEGKSLNTRIGTAEAQLTELGGLSGNARMTRAEETRRAAQTAFDETTRRIDNAKPDDRSLPTLRDFQTRASAVLKGIEAVLAPTKVEQAEAKRAEREANAAEREAAKRPLVTLADINRIVGGGSSLPFSDRIRDYGERSRADQVSPKGARGTMQVMAGTITDPGYGVRPAKNNTIAEIDRVGRDYSEALLKHYGSEVLASAAYNWGTGNVDKRVSSMKRAGTFSDKNFIDSLNPETKAYVKRVTGAGNNREGLPGGLSVVGLDEAETENKMTQVRARLKNAGVEATVTLDRASRKIVVSYRPGTRFSRDRSDDEAAKANLDLAQDQLAVDQADFKATLRDIGKSVSDVTFQQAVDRAEATSEQIADGLRDVAKKELAAQDVSEGSAGWNAKMRQVEETIQQNREALSTAISDGLIKSVDAQFKAFQTAADLAMKPYQDNVASAQGSVQGLSLYSNRFTPDYVSSLAQTRVARAQETETRARAATLPSQIDNDQAALDTFAAQVQAKNAAGLLSDNDLERDTQKIKELQKAIADLRTEKANLDAQLGSGGLVPTTIDDGITQAIASYREAHNLTQSFKQDVIDNLGGAVDAVSSGLNDMFTNILTGSQSALSAFAGFAKGIMQYVQQMVAKIIASKVLDLLFSLVGGSLGGGDFQMGGDALSMDTISAGRFNGGPIGFDTGGRVTNGSEAHDSVDAKLAKGEWVMQKSAVDSVGNDFMANLNAHGAKALTGMQAVPVLPPPAHQETNVYVVKPDQQPQLGKNDILVTINEDILNGGETKKLIKHVANGG